MTNEQARECFNQMIETFKAHGMADKVAEMEIAREYFTTPGFAKKLADYMWTNSKHSQ
jgi:hypothetical protein